MTAAQPQHGTFRIQVDTPASHVLVAVAGSFDLGGWDIVLDALRPLLGSGAVTVTIDLSEVTELEPAVVLELVRANQGEVEVRCKAPSAAALPVLNDQGASLIRRASSN